MLLTAFNIILTALVTSAVSLLSWYFKEKKRDSIRDDQDRQILRSLVRYSIVSMHDRAFMSGEVTLAERQTILDLMEKYKYLEGNGATEALLSDVMNLPTVIGRTP